MRARRPHINARLRANDLGRNRGTVTVDDVQVGLPGTKLREGTYARLRAAEKMADVLRQAGVGSCGQDIKCKECAALAEWDALWS